MNSVSIFSNILRTISKPCLTAPSKILIQQSRNTAILKRRNPLPLYEKNGKPCRLRIRNYIYDLVENTDLKRREPLKIILTKFVDGFGNAGDIISQPPMKAYNNFLLPGLAVYASPENIKKYQLKPENDEVTKKSHFLQRTVNILSQYLLNVVMSADHPWTLEKWHLRSSFRKAGVYLTDDCITTMPKHPISGPNFDIENKEFYITVTINKSVDVIVRCRIHHWSSTPNKKLICVPNFYMNPSEPIYPEDKPILDSLPIPYLIEKAMKEQETQTTP
ncbi:hypothetical protein PV327_000278 [Microctonus hyperodae]|uniref:Large ribosomal subunit protein bL9m n=1 Tax=Microctonus hyperodae TaxID=165561 RepID=A0AA39L1Z3_MICHY|nr:hypothetical protein PV327_000278 [Microctonus hyperodae]